MREAAAELRAPRQAAARPARARRPFDGRPHLLAGRGRRRRSAARARARAARLSAAPAGQAARRCASSTSRACTMPVLFVSGTRDAFGTPAELKRHAKKIKGPVDVPLDRDRRPRLQAAEGERPRPSTRRSPAWPRRSSTFVADSDATTTAGPSARLAAVRVDRWFAFVDLSGFTSFGDEFGDDESVRVLTLFRGAVRQVATDFGVRIAKWLGDGCMLVSVEPDAARRRGAASSKRSTHELELPLSDARGHGRRRGDPARGRRLHRPLREPRGAALRRGAGRTRSSRTAELAELRARRHAGRAGRDDHGRRACTTRSRSSASVAAAPAPCRMTPCAATVPMTTYETHRVRRATATSAGCGSNRPDKLNSFTVEMWQRDARARQGAARRPRAARARRDRQRARVLVGHRHDRCSPAGAARRDRRRSTTPAHATPTRPSTASCARRRRTRGSRTRATRRSPRCAATRSAPACSSRSRATSACSRAARRSGCSSTSTASSPTSAARSGCRASSARARRRS